MSRREDILSCIDVTIMDRSAHTALPSPHSKTFPSFWTGAAFTHTTGLGRKRFIDFIEPHTCVSAFIAKHGSKRTPPRIEHGLREVSLCKNRSIHIANDDLTIGLHQASAEQIQAALPASGPFQKRPKIEAGQEAPFALEHLDRQLVTVIKDRVDLAGQRRKPRPMLILAPQAQDPNRGRFRRSVHKHSIDVLRLQNTGKTAPNPQKRTPLSSAGLKAGVFREGR
jgi:hypothetical protein